MSNQQRLEAFRRALADNEQVRDAILIEPIPHFIFNAHKLGDTLKK